MKDKICQNQFGFWPKHSTTDLMIMTIEGIIRNLDSEGYVIPHDGIIKKLEYYGVRGLAKDLLVSYLFNL